MDACNIRAESRPRDRERAQRAEPCEASPRAAQCAVHHRRPVARRLPRRAPATPSCGRPNLDRLAAGGVSFRRHFAQAAPCGPSRAVALHRHVPDEPPVGAERHAARRPPRQRRARGAPRSATNRRCSATPTRASTPARSRPTTRGCRATRACCPGFDPVCHLPEGDPCAWLDWMRARRASTCPTNWRAFVDRPGRRARRWRTAVRRAEHTQTAFLTDRVARLRRRSAAAGSRGSRTCRYLRPHPPFLAPAPYDTMFDPASVPDAGARADARRGGRAAPAARRDDRPPVPRSRPTTSRNSASCRRPTTACSPRSTTSSAASSTGSTRSGQADRTLVVFTSRSRRDARRPLPACTSSAGSTSRSTCR